MRFHDLPERDDPADTNPRGARKREVYEDSYDDPPITMSSWSWIGLVGLAIAGMLVSYMIVSGIVGVIRILVPG